MDDNSTATQQGRDEIGQTIRTLRERQSLSVRTLATRAGFSASFISQVENGQASPSIGSMEKIANSLGVSMSEFFARRSVEDGGEIIVRAGEGNAITSEWSSASIRALGPSWQGRLLSPMLLSVDPGGRNGSSATSYQEELFAYVLEGQIQVRLNEDIHSLNAGDSIHLTSGSEHLWENHGDVSSKILLVMSVSR